MLVLFTFIVDSQVEFGGGTSSQYVMTATAHLLQVWDVLTCTGESPNN